MIYSCTLDASGYFYKLVENTEIDATFKLKYEINNHHGMHNLADEASETLDFELNVGPGESQMVILHRAISGSGFENKAIEHVVFGCDTLIKTALE